MARPRFNGQGFTNPTDPLGFHAESRHRESPPLTANFMSNETHFAENARGNQEFGVLGFFLGRGGAQGAKQLGKSGAKKSGGRLFGRFFGRKGTGEVAELGGKKVLNKKLVQEGVEETAESQVEKIVTTQVFKNAPVRTAMVKWGAIGLTTGIVALVGLGMLDDNAEEIICAWTGCNCDERAADAGMEEGTEEYTEYVEKCQESAGKTMEKIAYAGIGCIGLVVLLLLLPKKKKKSDDDSEDE